MKSTRLGGLWLVEGRRHGSIRLVNPETGYTASVGAICGRIRLGLVAFGLPLLLRASWFLSATPAQVAACCERGVFVCLRPRRAS